MVAINVGKPEPTRFNLLIIGESNLGKRTFLKSVLKKYNQEITIKPTEVEAESIKIEETCSFDVSSDTGDIHFHVYTSPGYGDSIDNAFSFDIIRNDLLARHDAWCHIDAQLLSEQERLTMDERIHCVLYFISPNKIKAIDLAFIKQMESLVPIVPIIGKADSMTPDELSRYLAQVSDAVMSLSPGDPTIYDFQENLHDGMEESLHASFPSDAGCDGDFDIPSGSMYMVGSSLSQTDSSSDSLAAEKRHLIAGLQSLPLSPIPTYQFLRVANIFAVIGSPTLVRKYAWGSLVVTDESLCDFRRLQRLLFEDGKHIRGMIRSTQSKTRDLYLPDGKCIEPNTQAQSTSPSAVIPPRTVVSRSAAMTSPAADNTPLSLFTLNRRFKCVAKGAWKAFCLGTLLLISFFLANVAIVIFSRAGEFNGIIEMRSLSHSAVADTALRPLCRSAADATNRSFCAAFTHRFCTLIGDIFITKGKRSFNMC